MPLTWYRAALARTFVCTSVGSSSILVYVASCKRQTFKRSSRDVQVTGCAE